MSRTDRNRWVWLAVTAGFICFIFGNSAMPGDLSSGNSSFALEVLQGMLKALHIPWDWLTEHMVRKAAHFAEYAVLGLLLCKTVKEFWLEDRKRNFAVLFFGLLTPVLDEGLQLLVAGRSGQVSDVLLDFSGVLTGCAAAWLCGRIFCRFRSWRRV